MNTLSRKQREIAERHALLLDIGRRLVQHEGYRNLSMDRIAELSEYSKGTVYQHFSCKEEILIQLCNHDSLVLKSYFERACRHPGSSREKMLALFLAHELWSALSPSSHELMQTLCGGGTKEKVRPESLQSHNQLEFEILGLVGSIVQQGVESNELTLPEGFNKEELVFGLWSICHGSLQLRSYDIALKDIGVPNAQVAVLRCIDAMLDGLGWTPLSNEHDYKASMEQIYQTTFADEAKQI